MHIWSSVSLLTCDTATDTAGPYVEVSCCWPFVELAVCEWLRVWPIVCSSVGFMLQLSVVRVRSVWTMCSPAAYSIPDLVNSHDNHLAG